MLLALIIKLFQKMWPKLGREQSWRVSMHAPFAWAPHHCRGARGGYESLLHPGLPWRFSHLLTSGCAFPVLLNSSWYIITNVPFLLSVNTKNPPGGWLWKGDSGLGAPGQSSVQQWLTPRPRCSQHSTLEWQHWQLLAGSCRAQQGSKDV